MRQRSRVTKRRGFTLIEMAVVLVLLGLAAGLVLKIQQTTQSAGRSTDQANGQNISCYAATQTQLTAIRTAINHYVRVYNRYPAPAARNIGVAAPAYGTEDTSGSSLDHNAGSTIYFGSLPIKTLTLPASFGADCWGNQFSYIVTVAMIQPGAAANPAANGTIIVKSAAATLTTNAVYAVVSHGASGAQSGNGGVSRNYTGGSHNWCNDTAKLDHNNCNLSAVPITLYSTSFNDGANAGSNFFDDVMIYDGKPSTNCNANSYNVSWVDGADHVTSCTGPLPGLFTNTADALAIATGANEGTATFQCNNGVPQLDPTPTDPHFPPPTCRVPNTNPAACGSTAFTCSNGTVGGNSETKCNFGWQGGFDQKSWTCTTAGNPPQSCQVKNTTCFLAEARITLADGTTKPVRDLQVGDAVRGHTRTNHVVKIPTFNSAQPIFGFNGGDAFVTAGHPFYTMHGWKAIDPALTPSEGHNVKTTQLHKGDVLFTAGGEKVTITSIDREESGEHALFNPVMDGDHTYYSNGFLVHNKNPMPGPDGSADPCVGGTTTGATSPE